MRRAAVAVGLALALSWSGSANAGVYSDDLSKCLVKAASPADVSVFMVWIFSALSLQPDVAPYSSMTQTQRDEASKKAALLLQRLMTEDCRAETVTAMKYEGAIALQTGFQVFGEVAGRGLFGSPAVAAGMSKMASYFDAAKLGELGKEAGIPTEAPKTK